MSGAPPPANAMPQLPTVDAHAPQQHPPQPSTLPPGYNPLKVPSSIVVRKDQVWGPFFCRFGPQCVRHQSHKTAEKRARTMHVITRVDLTKEMGTVNSIIAGINLIDSKSRATNAGLVFQIMGTHWVMELSSDAQKWAEEDVLLILFDVFFNAGYELKVHYDQSIKSGKGIGEEIMRESWLFQRVRAQPIFEVKHP